VTDCPEKSTQRGAKKGRELGESSQGTKEVVKETGGEGCEAAIIQTLGGTGNEGARQDFPLTKHCAAKKNTEEAYDLENQQKEGKPNHQ